jgi:hypothetical protein
MADSCSGLCRRSLSGRGIDPADDRSLFGFLLPAEEQLGGRIVPGRAWLRLCRRPYPTFSVMFLPAAN